MQNPSPDELIARYKQLPDEVRSYLASTGLGEAITSISQKYSLHVDVSGRLSECVTQMLIGLIDPTQLMAEMRAMSIPEVKAGQIARELNDRIFKPLHEAMRADAGKPARAPLTGVPAPLGITPPPPAPIAPVAPPPPVAAPVAPPPAPRPEPIIPPAVFVPPAPRAEREVTAPASIAPLPAPVPKNYARDPYREPIDEAPQA